MGEFKGGLDLTMAGLINFEDENEVKEFLDNLGTEYSFQCYKEKDPEGNIYLRCSRTNSAETLTKTTKRMFNECVLSQRPIFLLCFRMPTTGRLFGRSEKEL